MTATASTWVLGAGGLLGSAVVAALGTDAAWTTAVDWDPRTVETSLDLAVARYANVAGSDQWSLMWCAGAGVIGTSAVELERETASLQRVLVGLGRLEGPGRVLLASSAGGVWGGATDLPITESTAPAPLADYGRNKLVQESALREWATSTGNRVAIARISNLYGPGQALDKPQGLISQVCRSTFLRTPIPIYVSFDTMRDYLYVDDAAGMLVEMLEKLHSVAPSSAVTKIVASGSTQSIGGVLAATHRVLRRRPLVVAASSPNRRLQGSTLLFRSTTWTEIDRRYKATIAGGIGQVAAAMRRRIAMGALR